MTASRGTWIHLIQDGVRTQKLYIVVTADRKFAGSTAMASVSQHNMKMHVYKEKDLG